MSFLEITRDPGFVRVAALIRVPFIGTRWRHAHPEVPFWTLLRAFDNATKQDDTRDGIDREAAVASFNDLMLAIASADDRLRYSVDDVDWFVGVLDAPNAATTLAMLKAYASAPDVLYTPAELAHATQEGESTWRWRASTGVVPGAVKKGKQWLLPKSVLIAQGLLTQEQALGIDGQIGDDELLEMEP